MRPPAAPLFAALAAYTLLIARIEATAGAAAVRPYLEDPTGGPRLAAINTALSAGLLTAAAIVFLVLRRVRAGGAPDDFRERRFLALQGAALLALAFDERFRVLPVLAGVSTGGRWAEAALYGGLAGLEALLLVAGGRILASPAQTRWALLAGLAYGLALASDALLPAGTPGRWTLEDVPKVWGGAAVLGIAWTRLGEALAAETVAGREADGISFALGRTAGTWSAARRAREAAAIRLTELADPGARPARAARAGSAARAVASGQKKGGAPAPRGGAPEPVSSAGTPDSSAAPPRKLLSH